MTVVIKSERYNSDNDVGGYFPDEEEEEKELL